jgi:hypothetical protein
LHPDPAGKRNGVDTYASRRSRESQAKIKNRTGHREEAAVAVVVSIARGHDASYPFKTIGAADGATITGERGAGYYLSAVEKGGEPAGTWIGSGAATLGFNDGDTVRREDFEPLYMASSSTRATPQGRPTWAARHG